MVEWGWEGGKNNKKESNMSEQRPTTGGNRKRKKKTKCAHHQQKTSNTKGKKSNRAKQREQEEQKRQENISRFEDKSNEYLVLLNNRIRALRKKLTKIENLEKKKGEGHQLLLEQSHLVEQKASHEHAIEALEEISFGVKEVAYEQNKQKKDEERRKKKEDAAQQRKELEEQERKKAHEEEEAAKVVEAKLPENEEQADVSNSQAPYDLSSLKTLIEFFHAAELLNNDRTKMNLLNQLSQKSPVTSQKSPVTQIDLHGISVLKAHFLFGDYPWESSPLTPSQQCEQSVYHAGKYLESAEDELTQNQVSYRRVREVVESVLSTSLYHSPQDQNVVQAAPTQSLQHQQYVHQSYQPEEVPESHQHQLEEEMIEQQHQGVQMEQVEHQQEIDEQHIPQHQHSLHQHQHVSQQSQEMYQQEVEEEPESASSVVVPQEPHGLGPEISFTQPDQVQHQERSLEQHQQLMPQETYDMQSQIPHQSVMQPDMIDVHHQQQHQQQQHQQIPPQPDVMEEINDDQQQPMQGNESPDPYAPPEPEQLAVELQQQNQVEEAEEGLAQEPSEHQQVQQQPIHMHSPNHLLVQQQQQQQQVQQQPQQSTEPLMIDSQHSQPVPVVQKSAGPAWVNQKVTKEIMNQAFNTSKEHPGLNNATHSGHMPTQATPLTGQTTAWKDRSKEYGQSQDASGGASPNQVSNRRGGRGRGRGGRGNRRGRGRGRGRDNRGRGRGVWRSQRRQNGQKYQPRSGVQQKRFDPKHVDQAPVSAAS